MKQATDLLVILTAAALTALIALPILSPAVSRAEGEEIQVLNPEGPRRRLPGFTRLDPASMKGAPLLADGLELTLTLDQESYKAGEKPVVTLVAVNRTDKKCKTKAKVLLSSTRAVPAFARAMPMPVTVYEQELEIEVEPGKTLKLPLETGYAVTAGSMFNLTISVGKLFQYAGSFAVAAPAPADEAVKTTPVTEK